MLMEYTTVLSASSNPQRRMPLKTTIKFVTKKQSISVLEITAMLVISIKPTSPSIGTFVTFDMELIKHAEAIGTSSLGSPVNFALLRIQADATQPEAQHRNCKNALHAVYHYVSDEVVPILWKGARIASLVMLQNKLADEALKYQCQCSFQRSSVCLLRQATYTTSWLGNFSPAYSALILI